MTALQDLTVEQNNDVTIALNLTYNNAPFDVTNYTLTVYLKPSETAPDSTAKTFTTSSGLTIVNASQGQVTWKLPHTDTQTEGTQWWRIDAVDTSSNRATVIVGHLIVTSA